MTNHNGHFDGALHETVLGRGQADFSAFFGALPPPEHAQRNFEFIVNQITSMQRDMFNRMLDPRRDIDKECGFPKTVDANQYWELYNNDAIAARVCEVLPRHVWQVQPEVYEDEDAETQTPFELAWDDLCASLRPERSFYQDEKGNPVWNCLARADIMAGVGQYGVILLGFDDGLDLSEPVKGVEELYSMPAKVKKKPKPAPTEDGPTAVSDPNDPPADAPPTAPNAKDEIEKRAAKKTKPVGNRRYVLNWNADPNRPRGKFDLTKNAYRGPPPNTYVGKGADEYGFPDNKGERDKAAIDPNEDEEDADDLFPNSDAIEVDGAVDVEGNPIGEEPEFTPRNRLVYLRAFPEAMAQISLYETNPTSPRYCQPVTYLISFNDSRDQPWGSNAPPMTTRLVHWTRVIHVVLDGQSSSEIFGQERMRQVYRNILSLQKLYYGSAEMYWKGAFPGISFESHPQLGGQVSFDKTALRSSMEQMMNGLQRYMISSGGAAKMLSPTVVDPTQQIEVQIGAICVRIGIPIPVFKGYEIGEQASENNDKAWEAVKVQARNEVRTPKLIAPLVDRLINTGVLPEPVGYSVRWAEGGIQSETEKSQVALTYTQAMVAYISGNCATLMPPMEYLTRVWKLTEEEATAIVEAAERVVEEQKAEQEQQMIDQLDMQEDQLDRGLIPDPNDPQLVPDVAPGGGSPFDAPKPGQPVNGAPKKPAFGQTPQGGA